ncbi:MAG: capsule assembly Wzi family protein [Nitrospiraceae bacterium]|nr:capsule assembly Wzi family protein [Nitrospiraceae bacterium]
MFRRLLLFCFLFIIFSAPAFGATYIDLQDTHVYSALSRLEALGIIRSGLLDTKPLSRKEVFRLLHEAEANPSAADPFISRLLASLKDHLGKDPSEGTELRPLDSAYLKYAYTSAIVDALRYNTAIENEQPLNANNDGDLYKRGSNERLGFVSRLEDWGPLSIEINPEWRYPRASYTGYPDTAYETKEFVARKAYAVLSAGKWDLIVGKDSQWWGPGYDGALLLSNNAEPLTMIKVTNAEPVRLPWILDVMGPSRFTFFLTKLDRTRPVPEPYLFGMRFDFKPSPYVEFSLERTAIVGGEGRPTTFKTWIQSITGQSHGGQTDYFSPNYVNIDDERAGADLKVTIPWRLQPMQIYLEAAGEDESSRLPVPQDWAFVGGLYLPRILDAERFDFRLEYTTTRGRINAPYVWYTHNIYDSYTYEGNIIGHHIGTDADQFLAEISYLIPERSGRVYLRLNREEHNLHAPGSQESLHEMTVGGRISVTSALEVSAAFSYGLLRNPGNIAASAINVDLIETGMKYRF